MERRFGQRTRVISDVVVYNQGLPVAVARARNVSLLGAFVEMEPELLRKHRVIELEFSTGKGALGRYHRIPAMVVRHGERGIGLIFETSDPVTRNTVQELVREQRAAASVRETLVS